jgi:hypothetical protein
MLFVSTLTMEKMLLLTKFNFSGDLSGRWTNPGIDRDQGDRAAPEDHH